MVGVDVGLCSFAVLSDGTRVEPVRALERKLALLRRRSRQQSRKQRGSRNRQKSAMRLAKLHGRIAQVRRDAIHKLTTVLAKTKSVVVVEDLSVRNLMRWRRLARAMGDAAWSELRRQLEYKCRWYGSELLVAPRDFPTTRRCARCGAVRRHLALADRRFPCAVCGLECDRDLNAARNLAWYGQFGRNLLREPRANACGDWLCGGRGSFPVYEHLVEEAGSVEGNKRP